MKYDLYDFDLTAFPYDCETVFLFETMLTHPWLFFLIPYQLVCITLYFLGFGGKYKGKCFIFLKFVNGEKLVKKFWKRHEKLIYPFFYKDNRNYPSVVCSASPEFLITPICKKHGIDVVIATRMDIRNGKIIGKNCKDKEKIKRIKEKLPDAVFRNVYSDDLKSDIHIFRLGEKCFKAKRGTLTEMTLEEIESAIK